jgi:hypothetical protein
VLQLEVEQFHFLLTVHNVHNELFQNNAVNSDQYN